MEYYHYRGFSIFGQYFCQKKGEYGTMSQNNKIYDISEIRGYIMTVTRNQLKRRIAVARGLEPGDLVIKDCHIVDVYTQTTRKGDIVVSDGVIAGVGGPYEGKTVIDAKGAYAAPGLIESHIHIESCYVSPEEFGRLVVPFGTTTIVADPHEIVNVCGLKGLEYMMKAAEKTALDIHFMVPSCVPATPFDHSGATLEAKDMEAPLADDRILGVGEFMNCPGILEGHDAVLDKLITAYGTGKPIDGHSPGVHGKDLQAYISAQILTDHECFSKSDAEERVQAGMYVLLRNGSACHDLPKLVKAVTPESLRRFLLCSDDLHPKTIFEKGHLNEHLRLCVAAGLSPEAAITMGTLNAAECYHFDDRGALAPGKRADIVLFEDLQDFKVRATFIEGQKVAENGHYLPPFTRADYSSVGSSVTIADFSEEKLVMHLKSDHVRTIDIMPGGVVTGKGEAQIRRDEKGDFVFDEKADIIKVAVVERHHGTGNVGLGLLRGYGLQKGAVAVSIAHDSHNIIVAGAGNKDMAAAVEVLEKQKGGMAAVLDGKVLAAIPLPIAGLMSDKPAAEVDAALDDLYDKARSRLGVSTDVDVIMTLCFMSLPVIPKLKLLDTGLFDVEAFDFVSVELS